MSRMSSPDALDLPDTPRWLEAHDLARHPEHWRRDLGPGGCIALSASVDPIIVVFGGVPRAAVMSLADEHPDHTLLLVEPISNRACTRARIFTLPDPRSLPELDGATLLAPDTDLTHVPPELQGSLAEAEHVYAVHVDGLPVSFAYASARSDLYFDCAVDTLQAYRQLGLATITASTMIRAELAQGRDPVWCALEDNDGSLRLARKLGFVDSDELWVAAPG